MDSIITRHVYKDASNIKINSFKSKQYFENNFCFYHMEMDAACGQSYKMSVTKDTKLSGGTCDICQDEEMFNRSSGWPLMVYEVPSP